jgi:hypothetical protein
MDETLDGPALYLALPVAIWADADRWVPWQAGLAQLAPSCVLLERGEPRAMGPVIATIQAHEIAVMVTGTLDQALIVGCDGVHLDPPEDGWTAAALAQARRLAGKLNLGIGSGLSRHTAMLAGEAGADYVAFGAPMFSTDLRALAPEVTYEAAALTAWWGQVTEIPAVLVVGPVHHQGAVVADFLVSWPDPSTGGAAGEGADFMWRPGFEAGIKH